MEKFTSGYKFKYDVTCLRMENDTNRTTIQMNRELRKKLKVLEDYYDRPLNRIVRQIVNNEYAKLPISVRQEVAP